MKLILLLFFVLFMASSALRHLSVDHGWVESDQPHLRSQYKDIPEQWFTNYVDHFDPFNLNTFKQRFFENDENFQPYNSDSPIFLYLGLEGAISTKWLQQGYMFELSQRFGAHLMIVEHRYYGATSPVPDLSLNNLKYLTTAQALEDYAYFIKSFKEYANRPWVVFSGSYGGVLCQDMLSKYPYLIAGAISASGPFEPTVNFENYLVVAEQALEWYGGKQCVDDFETANKDLYTTYLQAKDATKMAELKNRLKLCTDLTPKLSQNDEYSLWNSLTDSFMEVIQYNKENVPEGKTNIKSVCDKMKAAENKLNALIDIHNMITAGHGEECRQWDYKWQVDQLSYTQLDPTANMRQWIFQSCSQYGFFQTNMGKTRAFGQHYPISFFGQLCQDAFSKDFSLDRLYRLNERSNATFGARDISHYGIVIANGNIDPWYALSSPKHNPYQGIYNYFIPGTSHCAVLYASSTLDPQALTDARAAISLNLNHILQEYPMTKKSVRPSPFPIEPAFNTFRRDHFKPPC